MQSSTKDLPYAADSATLAPYAARALCFHRLYNQLPDVRRDTGIVPSTPLIRHRTAMGPLSVRLRRGTAAWETTDEQG